MARKLFDKLINWRYTVAISKSKANKNLREFADKNDIYFYDLLDCNSDLPCYCMRYTVGNEINTKELIEKYLKVTKDYSQVIEDVELTMFSLTEKDAHHELWLEVAAEQGLIVIETRSRQRGRYKCWMILQKVGEVK